MVGLNSDRTSPNSIPYCHAKQEETHKTVRPFHWKVCIGVKKKKRNISSSHLEGFISFLCLIKSCLVILLKDNLTIENTSLLHEIMHQQILICTRLDPGCRKAKPWPEYSHWFRIEELCPLSVLTLQDSLTCPSSKIYQSAEWGVEWMCQWVWSSGQEWSSLSISV